MFNNNICNGFLLLLFLVAANVMLEEATYIVSEVQEVQRVCINITGTREINLTVTLSTQPQTASGKHLK